MVIAAVLASCGGDGGNAANPGGNNPAGGGTQVIRATPAATPTGRLSITVSSPDRTPLANARVTVFNGSQSAIVGTAVSDQNGMAHIDAVPETVVVTVDHPFGSYRNVVSDVRQFGASTGLDAFIQPASPVTVALLPVTMPAGSISADRTELELHFHIVASATAPFVPSSYGNYAGSLPTPLLRLKDCVVWLDSSHVAPACIYPSTEATASDYAYDPLDTSLPSPESEFYSALLLMDQSRRVAEYDPKNLRSIAAKHFIRRGRLGDWESDLVAVAGFAGQGGDASWPPLLPQLPLWVPSSTPYLFSSHRVALEAAVDSMEPLVGGAAPVFDAFGAALTLIAAQPTSRRRAIVALLGGGDESGLTASQRQAALASLRQQQAVTDVRVILVAGQMDEDSVGRKDLAELAAALRAPIIHAGNPADWLDQRDGLYSAMDLAASLLAGLSLPSVEAVFRLKSDQPGGFQSGSMLHGTVWIESDRCPMGCTELPLQFAVAIP